jgi:N-acetylmuramoyl-L-alanine amidase
MKIYLDAGHYGKYNQSKVVPEYYESDMNWKLHLNLKEELEKYNGVEVMTTREDKDNDLEPTARGKMSKGCDLLLSLHSNGASREDADHVVIFVPLEDKSTDIDEKSRELANKLAPMITDLMGVKERNYRVASVKSSNDRNCDGILNDNYYGVLHGARMVETPALIIEHSFHTNKRSAEWLLVDANLSKLAKEEAKVIAEHYGLSLKGDVNGDGKVDSADVTAVSEVLAGIKEPSKASDVNGDGIINVSDLNDVLIMTSSKKQEEPKPKTVHRVQIGAYLLKKNAEKMMTKLHNAGYAAIIVKSGLYYKVQVGSYSYRSNAEKMMAGLKAKGYSAFIVEAQI